MELSAIVILVDEDVHSVYLVPVQEAIIENMVSLREQKNKRDRAIGTRVRIQRVLITQSDQDTITFADISKRLEEILNNIDY
jgi:two-component sensor histidine kinase